MNEDRFSETQPNLAPLNSLVCGFLVFASRWLIPPGSFGSHWNFFITGLAIVFIAMATMIAHGNVARNYWSALNVATGCWLLVSTLVFPNYQAVMWAQICLGILTVTSALTSLVNEERIRRSRPTRSLQG